METTSDAEPTMATPKTHKTTTRPTSTVEVGSWRAAPSSPDLGRGAARWPAVRRPRSMVCRPTDKCWRATPPRGGTPPCRGRPAVPSEVPTGLT